MTRLEKILRELLADNKISCSEASCILGCCNVVAANKETWATFAHQYGEFGVDGWNGLMIEEIN